VWGELKREVGSSDLFAEAARAASQTRLSREHSLDRDSLLAKEKAGGGIKRELSLGDGLSDWEFVDDWAVLMDDCSAAESSPVSR
jgi:hypothetical protein